MPFMIDTDVLIWVLRRNQTSLDWLKALAAQGGSRVLCFNGVGDFPRGQGAGVVPYARCIAGPRHCAGHLRGCDPRRRHYAAPEPRAGGFSYSGGCLRLQAHVVTYNRRDF